MNRRTLLRTLGVATTGVAMAGCAGTDTTTDEPTNATGAADGQGPTSQTTEATQTDQPETAAPTQTVTTSTLRKGTTEATEEGHQGA